MRREAAAEEESMYHTVAQWLLYFFFYCFVGWVWETCYVSIRKREWVNRGFLRGPWLPIYGFGAVLILIFTFPVRNSLWLTYLVGMIGATVLEYVTGTVMEAVFHVRYWDYSDQPLNVHGHICLGVSLGWGVFSLLMVRVIHQPVTALLQRLPEPAVLVLDAVLLALFAADVVTSVKAALNLKKLLAKVEEGIAHFQELERKARESAERLQEWKLLVQQKQAELLDERNRQFRRIRALLRRNPSAISGKYVQGLKKLREWIKK